MISKKLQDAFNKQINEELYSAYLYFSMSAYLESVNLTGMAHWMRMQAQEEMGHVVKFYTFINERGGRVILDAIDKPKSQWKSALNVFEEAYKHEQKVTQLINGLVDLAKKESDHAADSFLQWFVDEQVEEESVADDIVQKLKMIADNTYGLFMMDKELNARATPPVVSGTE